MDLSMTESQFRQEICDKLENDYNEFKYYQEVVLDTLNAFHQVCVKNDISYCLAYGSLLGAVRDGGQIPWDYDVDLWVWHDDIPRLLEALDSDLPKKYYYVCRYKDMKHRHFMMRLAPNEFDSEVLHVDVFWLFGAPTDADKLRRMVILYNRRRALGRYKYLPNAVLEYNQPRPQRFFLRLKKFVVSLLPSTCIDYFHYKALRKANPQSDYCCDEFGILMKKEWLAQKCLMTFSNGMHFYVPAGYKEMLNSLYGDWQSYLSISDRMSEFQTSLQRIRKLGKREK